jgi:hypothetical protein
MAKFTDHIDCEMSCEIPEGVTLTELPPPRHDWGGILRCPNDGCGRFFLVEKEDD